MLQKTDLLILGAGITGLATAYYLRNQISCLILESSNETGGVIKTNHQDGFTLEQGPDCFMTHKPWALDLALELGLQTELIESNNHQKRVLLLKNNEFKVTDHQDKAVTEFLGNRTQAPSPDSGEGFGVRSFKAGMQMLTHKLHEHSENRILLNTQATHIDWQNKIITCNSGLKIKAKAILLALPAAETANLLQIKLPFKTTQTASVYLAYPRESIEHKLDAFGLIIPAAENRKISALTFVSSKFDHRCPKEFVLFRAFLKGDFGNARQEIESLFKPKTAPVLETGFRITYADPKYAPDHLEQVKLLEQNLPHKVFIAGSPYRGVGISDCIHQALEVSENILKFC